MFIKSKFISSALTLLILVCAVRTKWVIWDEVITGDRLETRIKIFNEWYAKFNPESLKVEARLTEDPELMRIGLYAKENIKAEEVYLKVNKNKIISSNDVYQTPIGPIIKKLESVLGYDDYTNMVFYLLHEMNNKNSEWKPYLDLLPRQPTSIAFKYWERKNWIEEELMNTPILSKQDNFYKFKFLEKIVDYKILLEKKSRFLYTAIVANNTKTLDSEFYNKENIEWACLVLDSRIIYVDYEAFLIPMLDFANYRENPKNPNRVFNAKFSGDSTEIKAGYDVNKNDQLFESLKYSNDKMLMYHGITLENNYHDCFLLTLGFTSRQEDSLKHERKNFFAKFFLYDENNSDTM